MTIENPIPQEFAFLKEWYDEYINDLLVRVTYFRIALYGLDHHTKKQLLKKFLHEKIEKIEIENLIANHPTFKTEISKENFRKLPEIIKKQLKITITRCFEQITDEQVVLLLKNHLQKITKSINHENVRDIKIYWENRAKKILEKSKLRGTTSLLAQSSAAWRSLTLTDIVTHRTTRSSAAMSYYVVMSLIMLLLTVIYHPNLVVAVTSMSVLGYVPMQVFVSFLEQQHNKTIVEIASETTVTAFEFSEMGESLIYQLIITAHQSFTSHADSKIKEENDPEESKESKTLSTSSTLVTNENSSAGSFEKIFIWTPPNITPSIPWGTSTATSSSTSKVFNLFGARIPTGKMNLSCSVMKIMNARFQPDISEKEKSAYADRFMAALEKSPGRVREASDMGHDGIKRCKPRILADGRFCNLKIKIHDDEEDRHAGNARCYLARREPKGEGETTYEPAVVVMRSHPR